VAAALDPGAPPPRLELTVYFLDVAQVPHISLDSEERAAQRISGKLGFETCWTSTPPLFGCRFQKGRISS
jgi:hypothetical protein